MNDFTKEELEIIYLDMTIYATKGTPLNESPSHLDLRNKVQSLINDYCDHERTCGCLDCGTIECMKCNERFSYEKYEELSKV
jgi:hypothetical protein